VISKVLATQKNVQGGTMAGEHVIADLNGDRKADIEDGLRDQSRPVEVRGVKALKKSLKRMCHRRSRLASSSLFSSWLNRPRMLSCRL
jgi:hypothetical protein